MFDKTIVKFVPEIKGCYGPKLYVPAEACESIHHLFRAMSMWGGATGDTLFENKKYFMYEVTQETFDSPLFKQILRWYNVTVDVFC